MTPLIDWLFNTRSPNKTKDWGLLALRLLFGVPLSFRHGWPTVMDWWRGEISYPDPLGLGESLTMLIMGTVEAICPIFVIVGFFTRIAAFFVAFGFVVAVLVAHASDPFAVRELAYMYMSGFFAVFLLGPGKFSIDNHLSRRQWG